MKYIETTKDGITRFDTYFEYLKLNRNKFPNHVYEFAINYQHYKLDDRSSLHDTWLEFLKVEEIYKDKGDKERIVNIELCLLGAYHDRKIFLKYLNIVSFNLKYEQKNINHHGDLLIHEVRLYKENIIHELEFSSGSTYEIVCKDIIHCERT